MLLSHCFCLPVSASLFLSLSLSLAISLSLSVPDSFPVSVSCPGQAKPRAWGDRQAGRLLLVFRPGWRQAQPGCCSGILQPPCSSHQAQSPPASPPSTFCPKQGVLGAGGGGGNVFLLGSSYRTARPGSPATSAAPDASPPPPGLRSSLMGPFCQLFPTSGTLHLLCLPPGAPSLQRGPRPFSFVDLPVLRPEGLLNSPTSCSDTFCSLIFSLPRVIYLYVA